MRVGGSTSPTKQTDMGIAQEKELTRDLPKLLMKILNEINMSSIFIQWLIQKYNSLGLIFLQNYANKAK